MTPHALTMKRFASVPGDVTSGAIAGGGSQSHILMASDALTMKGLGPTRHGLIVDAFLVTIAAMRGSGRIILRVFMMTVGAADAEIHAVGVMIKFSVFAKGRDIIRRNLVAVTAGNRQNGIVIIGMVTVPARQAVKIHMGLMVEQDLSADGWIHQTDGNLRRFRRQHAVEKHTDNQTDNGDRITQFGFVL
jgi:hypothetical protein